MDWVISIFEYTNHRALKDLLAEMACQCFTLPVDIGVASLFVV